MDEINTHAQTMYRQGYADGCAAVFDALLEMEQSVSLICRTRMLYCREVNGRVHITLDLDPKNEDELLRIAEVLDESPTLHTIDVKGNASLKVLRWAHPHGVYSVVAWSDRLRALGFDTDATAA